MIDVVSVRCASSDAHLHLAPYTPGLGTEVHTLCLERWTDYEPYREDSQLCPVCVEKWKFNSTKERSNG